MNKYHLLAHNNKNFVKVGDIVKQYKTKIGTIGTANGLYLAHLHHSVSKDLDVGQLRRYIRGWSKDIVKSHYEKPTCDYNKMFGRKMDIGNAGYGWLDIISDGISFHPGIDINGLGGGNSDIGYEYTSPCDGIVIYVNNTDSKDGWGKMVVIEEVKNNMNEEHEKNYKKIAKAVAKKVDEDYGDNPNDKETKKILEKLDNLPVEKEVIKEVEVEKIIYRNIDEATIIQLFKEILNKILAS